MKPAEALGILDQAVSQLQISRQNHATLVEAINVLNEAINPKKDVESKAK